MQSAPRNIIHVGGKGANLGELTNAGFDVPPGFCVSTAAYFHFIGEVADEIYAQLDNVTATELETVREIGATVRARLMQQPLPSAVKDALVAAWQTLGAEHAYAVRSSATAEDLPHASFAGQQDTYLNVRGHDALLSNVKACFVSLFTDRAILYRIQNGFDHRQVAISVVVQQMVQPSVSGILFTADPVTGNRHIASIDASFGLGEALVSGLVSADLYQVDKRTLRITKRQIATKQLVIRSLEDGGTEQIALSETESKRAALNDRQITVLAKLGSRIEQHYGRPQDIEWAIADDILYITQSRRSHRSTRCPSHARDDDALHVYFSMSHPADDDRSDGAALDLHSACSVADRP